MNSDKQYEQTASARSPATVKADTMIRRLLRVGDPWNATEVAEGLQRLYSVESQALEGEARGIPYLNELIAPPTTRAMEISATSREEDQARSDVDHDLATLTQSSLVKDIAPELRGWAGAIRNAVADGIHAAQFALDPQQRDRAFAGRGTVRDYARLARYVGTLTPHVNPLYRSLARSLDEVSAIVLVKLGERLAEVGLSDGSLLLQAPVGELQNRRDSILVSLRNLHGSTQETMDSNTWPRGLVALRDVQSRLERHGQSDLRALLQEAHMSKLLDDIIDQAAAQQGDGLRAMAASAQVSLQQLRRLFLAVRQTVQPEAPPIAALLSSINLLLDAFAASDTAIRLLYLSRPPLVFYGFYGLGGPDQDSETLVELVQSRGQLAELLDCSLDCECGIEHIVAQALLDKVLYDLDQAIDLYVLGDSSIGAGEFRARASGYAGFIELVLNASVQIGNRVVDWVIPDNVRAVVELIHDNLQIENPTQEMIRLAGDELCQELATEQGWNRLARSMAPNCREPETVAQVIDALLREALTALNHDADDCTDLNVDIPATLETSLEGLAQDRPRFGWRRTP